MKRFVSALLLITVFLSFMGGCAVSKNDYAFKSGNAYGSILPAHIKIGLTDDIPVTADRKIALRVGKNDMGASHFFLTDDSKELKNVSASVSEFKTDAGNVLKSGSATVCREYFHPITGISGVPYWPDALIPLSEKNNSATVKKGENTAFWFEVTAPAETKSGIYKGSLDITYDGGAFSVPVEIEVVDIEIPEVSTLGSYGAVFTSLEYEYKGRTPEELEALLLEMHELLLKNRISPARLPKMRADFNTPEEYANYIADCLEADPRIKNTTLNHYGYRDDNGVYHFDDLAQIYKVLEARGVLDKCCIYERDEPTAGNSGECLEFLAAIKKVAPNLRNLICTNRYLPEFVGPLNFWCSTPNVSQSKDIFDRVKATGADFWQYGGDSFGGLIYGNGGLLTLTDYAKVHKNNIEGMLYWSVYHSGLFDSVNNVYLCWDRDMWNNVYCFLPAEVWGPGGEGATYYYPGFKDDGIVNEDKICESLRGKYIRESAELYELLTIRENQFKEFIEKYNLSEYVTSKELMDNYYNNFEYAVNGSANISSPILIASENIIKTLYDDILSFDLNKPVTAIVDFDEETLFKLRDIKVFAAPHKEITVNGQRAEEKTINENISVYTYEYSCENAFQNIYVNVGDEYVLGYPIYAKAVNQSKVNSLFDGGKITREDYDKIVKSSRGNALEKFENDKIYVNLTEDVMRVNIKDVGNLTSSDYANATHVAVTLSNETPDFIVGLQMIVGNSRSSVSIDDPIALDPGKETTIYISLDDLSINGLKLSAVTNLRFLNSRERPSDNLRLAISDISFVEIK